ncbi:SH3 domain binding glutamic acid-rich protein-like [Apophysomyces ossiformis]|uniref:SH3 domain binding glutamic acid-rich protein-like n=1 Tax=Apophysomyces ossiformis TaxID=679940 RepID=A0A8H7ER01_9FUNG|nr:SH3 domain binding glutamic acid-rich protein-like [Apophysomyces ossiformis]
MPCFGSRKTANKSKVASMKDSGRSGLSNESALSHSGSMSVVAQIKQEYADLKSKNDEQLGVISRQSAELEHLRQQLNKTQESESVSETLNELERKNKETLAALEQKETMLKQRETEMAELLQKLEQEKEKEKEEKACADQLAERDALLRSKEQELEELQLKWKAEQAAMVKPALDEVTKQMEELKKAIQKQKHEAVLQTHAEAMAEKDRALVQHQKSLSDLKGAHDRAIKTLQREQTQTLEEVQARHERDMQQLRERLGEAEKRAKSDMNDEVERLLQEFEQSEHTHSVQMADLQKSHREQMTMMRRGQQAEIKQWMGQSDKQDDKFKVTLRSTGGPGSKVRWPIAAMKDKTPEVVPRDPALVQVYMSSVSTNSSIKRNQESIQTMLTSSKVQYEVVDVAQSEQALQYMRRQSATDKGRAKPLPQVFVGGEYRGQLEDLTMAIDNGQLEQFLRPREQTAQTLSVPSKQKSTSSLSSTGPVTPPSSTPVIQPKKDHREEDEELFKEMAMELSQSDFAKFDFNF